jgi:hypothetical protein
MKYRQRKNVDLKSNFLFMNARRCGGLSISWIICKKVLFYLQMESDSKFAQDMS